MATNTRTRSSPPPRASQPDNQSIGVLAAGAALIGLVWLLGRGTASGNHGLSSDSGGPQIV